MDVRATHLLYVFLGGGFGASSRFLLSRWILSFSPKFWMGTLAVNLLGCLAFFLIDGFFSASMGKDTELFLKVGILGGLTTFSTLSFEAVSLIKQGHSLEALAVLGLNIVFGLIIGIAILR